MSEIPMVEANPEKISSVISAITEIFQFLSKEEVSEFFH